VLTTVMESQWILPARLSMPLGTPIERTAEVVEVLERSAEALTRELDAEFDDSGVSLVRHVLVSVGEQPDGGTGPPRQASSTTAASHLGQVTIELQSGDERPIAARDVADRWRTLTPPVPGAEELVFVSSLFSVGDPIDVQLQAVDLDVLERAADELKAHLAGYPGVVDISDSFREGKEEIQLTILPEAEALGLTLEDLARQVRQAFYGEEAQRIQRGRDDVKVMVRYPETGRRSIADLENLRIRTPAGGEVPFYAVARAERGRGYASIRRADRQRIVRVTADIDLARANAEEILGDLEAGFLPRLVADHRGLSYSLEGEQSEQRKTVGALARSYLFALVLIYALLAIPLRSYAQPFIIMAVIPFGLVGAIVGHLFMGLFSEITFNMMSVFGVVALSGVVVNASLVLVHYVNGCRERGQELREAVRQAGVARFRPIVLTSLTTFAGLIPLLSERSVSAQFLIPMATSLGFGVLFATLISLFLVPASYVVLDDVKPRLRARSASAASRAGCAAASRRPRRRVGAPAPVSGESGADAAPPPVSGESGAGATPVPSQPARIFVSRAIPEAALQRMAEGLPGARIEVSREDRTLTPEELRERARGASALVCTLADRVDEALLEALGPGLRVVATFAVGYENIDLDAARARGVRVTHTPGVLTDATAEIAVALILACARRLVEGDRLLRRGGWRGWEPLGLRGHGVTGKTVGIVGAGRIGRRVAETLRRGFGCEILVHSRTRAPGWAEGLGAREVTLEALLRSSHFVSLHCPLTNDTRHLIDAAALARMRPDACLVNTARGAVVDEAALVRALREKQIAAAGLDVYEHEPRLADGLARLDNAVLLPHLGSATLEARDAMGRLVADAVVAVLSGREPPHALV
jgi:lactate dehydrogenase-like 2-hydroxyacid dehydrogenase